VNPEGGHHETLEGTEVVGFGLGIRRHVRRLHLAVADSGIPGPQTGARPIGWPFPEIAMTPRLGMPFEERFGLLKELMRAVDLVTLAGREHVMNKMLTILRRETLHLESPIAASDLASLSNAMMELEHEVGRLAPMPSVFNRHVEIAIDALGRTGRDAPLPVGG
jgi:hypothetical protein